MYVVIYNLHFLSYLFLNVSVIVGVISFFGTGFLLYSVQKYCSGDWWGFLPLSHPPKRDIYGLQKYLHTTHTHTHTHIHNRAQSIPHHSICLPRTMENWLTPVGELMVLRWKSQRIKGTVSHDFRLVVFSWISFPQGPEYTIRAVSNLVENSRRYSQLEVSTTPVANGKNLQS